jgi:hypothetical protein
VHCRRAEQSIFPSRYSKLTCCAIAYLVLVEIVKRKLMGSLLRDGSEQGGAVRGNS